LLILELEDTGYSPIHGVYGQIYYICVDAHVQYHLYTCRFVCLFL